MNLKWLYVFPLLVLVLGFNVSTFNPALAQEDNIKPRILVMTDIGGGDPDDEQSFIRFLMYANEFDIEGLIASSDLVTEGGITHSDLLREIIRLYGEVHGNLLLHDADYPSAESLLNLVVEGQPLASPELDVTESIGPDKDTAASQHIIDVVDREDTRPVNITAWGGTADLAQALWRVRQDRSPEELSEFISKIRAYAIADQDSTGVWIRENFPDLFYILNLAPDGQDPFTSVFRGMYRQGDTSLVNRDWVNTHIRNDHGPLGARYPEDGAGVEGIKEGDTPSFFYFLDNGLQNPQEPTWGGWGGRFQQRENGFYYQDAEDTIGNTTNRMATIYRWREDYQNDFAARMDWNTLSYEEANHAPSIIVDQDTTFTISSGQSITVDASQSTDPDGDALSFDWFYYREPGTFSGSLNLTGADTAQLELTTSVVAAPQTAHIILRVFDDGSPSLVSYQRFVVTIEPDQSNARFDADTAVNGIKAEYYSGREFDELLATQIDNTVNFTWQDTSPAPGVPQDNFSVRWTGWLMPEHSEAYTFYTVADDGVRLYVDGELLVNDWQNGAARENSATVALQANQYYSILIEYFDSSGNAEVNLLWSSDSLQKQTIASDFFYIADNQADQFPESIHILPLGDSITQSNGSHNSYRRPLWHLLQENGYTVDFVGSQTNHHEGSAPDKDFDLDHEGHWGWRVDELLAQLPGWLESYTPDIVLMHVGTNDIFQNRSVDETLANMTALVDVLREDNPDVTILVAQVIPHNRGDRPSLTAFNEAIPAWVESVDSEQSQVILVDQVTGFDPSQDTFDRVHPNAVGEEKMAQRWFEALQNVLN